MESCRLDYEKYKERLKTVFPTYSDEELREFFRYYVEYLEVLLIRLD